MEAHPSAAPTSRPHQGAEPHPAAVATQSHQTHVPALEPGGWLQETQGGEIQREAFIYLSMAASSSAVGQNHRKPADPARAHLGIRQRARLLVVHKSGLGASTWRAAWPVKHPLSPGLPANAAHHVASAFLLKDGRISPQLSLHRQPELAEIQNGSL